MLASKIKVGLVIIASIPAFVGLKFALAEPSTDDVLNHLELNRAACQVMLDSATTNAQRNRATTCMQDATRAINSLTNTNTTPPPTTTTSPPTVGDWPNPENTGVPAGWTPRSVFSNTVTLGAGATLEDAQFNNGAGVIIAGAGATLRRVLFNGGKVNNVPNNTCFPFTISQSTFNRPSNANGDEPTIKHGGYTADRIKMDGVTEGFRIGGRSAFNCGVTTISNSWVRVQRETVCNDWHGDGAQGYDGPAVVVRNVAFWLDEQGCGGTAPWFYPRNQGNLSVDIDRVLVRGGGFSFRNGMPGNITNLKIVNNSWGYGPIDVRCSVVTQWSADIVTINSNWQPTTVRSQPCNTEEGF